ncbi:MAG TPA: radical SAM protein [Myxococcota bacterium]|nr:radical SAM protein [Myxococcota bacterium]HQK52570.1 radical SAM protein [Myxococcota bacterium]
MKVLLVNPPRSPHNALRDHAPEAVRRFVHTRLVGPPLGLLTVAVAAREEADVTFLDLKGEYDLRPESPPVFEWMVAWLRDHPADVVGVTFIASEHPAGMEVFRAARSVDPDILTVAGGLHPTLCPEDYDHPDVDVLIPGDGALVFRDLLRSLRTRGRTADVPGVRFRRSGRLQPMPGPPPPVDPAGRDFLVPDRSYLRPWMASYTVGGDPRPVTYLYTSLGCTSRCSFCSIWPQRQGGYFLRSIDSIVEEMRLLDEYEVVRLADANTVVDIPWTHALLDRIEAEGIRKALVMDIRLDTAARHPDLIGRLARAGLRVVITGVESPRPEDLRRYQKALTPDHITEGLRVFADHGILLRANYVVDPDWDLPDFQALAEFAAAHQTAYAGYTVLTPMPGTALHRQMRDRIVDFDLARYNFFNCVLRTRLPLDRFYRETGALWGIRAGEHVIS